MTNALRPSIARIFALDKRTVVGCGVLISKQRIITCTHVVCQALNIRETSSVLPQGTVTLDFPLIKPKEYVYGSVVFWDDTPNKDHDIAILELIALPHEVLPAKLVVATDIWGHQCRVFGFPSGHDNGVWAECELKAAQANKRVQIESVRTTGYRIAPGFSGTPVWDEQLEGVIGIVVTADAQKETKAASIIPISEVSKIHSIFDEEDEHSETVSPNNVIGTSHICNLIANTNKVDPIFLIGAGASQKSGIPLCKELVEQAAKWAFCRENQFSLDDPSVVRSDWLPWLYKNGWYNTQKLPNEQYVSAITNLLKSDEERTAFFQRYGVANHQIADAGLGYRNLLHLMALSKVQTVLTTNFDSVLPTVAVGVPNPRRLRVIRSVDDYRDISTAPPQPQLIYLYGDLERYSDNYFSSGHKAIDGVLIDYLVPLLRDHPLVVVGYRGNEVGLMRNFLFREIARLNQFRHGIYWAILPSEIDDIHPLVKTLADNVGSNFHFVAIDSFDDLMKTLVSASQQNPTKLSTVSVEPTPQFLPFDMQVLNQAVLDDFDWLAVQEHVVNYCKKMDISVPSTIDRIWLIEQMQSLHLLHAEGEDIHPTVAGYLLFGKGSSIHLPTACLEIRVSGEEGTLLKGNLWQQLQVVDALESEFNAPFRLKGAESEIVTPYPPLALKEIIVNALAHRRYDTSPNNIVTIRVESDHISVSSPGGLYEPVQQQIPKDMKPEDALGTLLIKGYRNPIIADFLYSTGDMDKAGSGLIDVRKAVRQNQGELFFHLGTDNNFFEVKLYRRREQPDQITGAAQSTGTEFVTNILEVVQLPQVIWSDVTTYRRAREILDVDPERNKPAFTLYDERLYSFSDLSNSANPLRQFITKTDIRQEPVSNFLNDSAKQRRIVHLLNEALRNLAQVKGLIFDWRRKRAYFPRSEDGENTITYQGRLRKATRTVVKARISPVSNKAMYWEHQAIEFHFRHFGDTWGLQLLPTYVFTTNGYYDKLPPERNGPLATRRLSHEYNVHVDNHLSFWTSILSDNNPEIVLESEYGSRIVLRSSPASCTLYTIEPQTEEDASQTSVQEDSLNELEELLWGDNEVDGRTDDLEN